MPGHMIHKAKELIGALKDVPMLHRSVPTLLGPLSQLTIARTAYREVTDVHTVLLPDCVEHLLRVIPTLAQMIRARRRR
jgi:hypothetical protein